MRQALRRAGELGASTRVGRQLELIAIDFLATNGFLGADDPLVRARYLAKLGRLMNIAIVGYDVKSGDLVYFDPRISQLVPGDQ